MTRFITKKDAWGKNKHIPIRERGGGSNTSIPSITILSVRPEREGNKLTGDEEFIGSGITPDMVMNRVRKFILDRKLSGTSSSSLKEEFSAYTLEGQYRTRRQFSEMGGDFDYIVETRDGKKKYMVNGSIKKKGSTWDLSGIGTWMREETQ